MSTDKEISEAIAEKVQSMNGISVHVTVKNAIAQTALLMECCFAVAKDLMEPIGGKTTPVELRQMEHQVGVELFKAFLAQAVPQQKPVTVVDIDPRLLTSMS